MTISLKLSLLLIVLLQLPTLLLTRNYSISGSCGACQLHPNCQYSKGNCLFFDGRKIKHFEANCFEIQACPYLPLLQLNVSDSSCKSDCGTCCVIGTYKDEFIQNDCVPDEYTDIFCDFTEPIPDPDSGSLGTGAIIGIAVGGFVGLALIIGVTIYCVRKAKAKGQGYNKFPESS